MVRFVRWIGIINAAVWLGAGVFLTFGVGPILFSPAVVEEITRQKAGLVAQVVLAQYFKLQYLCAAISLIHLVAARRSMKSGVPLKLSLVLLALALGGGLWLQPKLHRLNQTRYSAPSSEAAKGRAASDFKRWHGISQMANLAVLAGVFIQLCASAQPLGGSSPKPKPAAPKAK